MQNKQYALDKNVHGLKHDAYAGYICTKPTCHSNCILVHTLHFVLLDTQYA